MICRVRAHVRPAVILAAGGGPPAGARILGPRRLAQASKVAGPGLPSRESQSQAAASCDSFAGPSHNDHLELEFRSKP